MSKTEEVNNTADEQSNGYLSKLHYLDQKNKTLRFLDLDRKVKYISDRIL